MNLQTHLELDQSLCGYVNTLKEGYAKIQLQTIPVMKADQQGLVHGGFVFGAADFAAMAAVNDPLVVLAKSECRFLAPIKVGESVIFEATVTLREGKKHTVEVSGSIADKKVFSGTFYAVIPGKHVLS